MADLTSHFEFGPFWSLNANHVTWIYLCHSSFGPFWGISRILDESTFMLVPHTKTIFVVNFLFIFLFLIFFLFWTIFTNFTLFFLILFDFGEITLNIKSIFWSRILKKSIFRTYVFQFLDSFSFFFWHWLSPIFEKVCIEKYGFIRVFK